VGGRFEDEKFKGISHYLEHMLFKGSKKYTCQQIKETIEGKGGSLNGFTAEEFTCYLVKVLKENLNESLEILSDMVLFPVLEEEEINKERTVIMEEIKMYHDLPQYYVLEILDSLLWADHPLGSTLTGTSESVSAIGRKELSSYRDRFYNAPNIVIALCGAFDLDSVVKSAKNIFVQKQGVEKIIPLAANEGSRSPKLKGVSKPTEQSHLALGFRSYDRKDPRRHILDVLHVVMGANMSSRLFQEVREKRGLAYSIGTAIKRFKDSGAFTVHAGVDNKKVDECVKVVAEEFDKIKDGPTESELRRAKDFYLGQVIMALEDVSEHMLFMGEGIVTLDKVMTLKEKRKAIESISASDVKRVAKDIFDLKKIHLSLISPDGAGEVEALSKRFK
jgi:predicted Zn-dependent peptidase